MFGDCVEGFGARHGCGGGIDRRSAMDGKKFEVKMVMVICLPCVN